LLRHLWVRTYTIREGLSQKRNPLVELSKLVFQDC